MGVIDDGREEVHRLDDGDIVAQPVDGGVVRVLEPDEQVGKVGVAEGLFEWAQDLRQRGDARLAGSTGAGRQACQAHLLAGHVRTPFLSADGRWFDYTASGTFVVIVTLPKRLPGRSERMLDGETRGAMHHQEAHVMRGIWKIALVAITILVLGGTATGFVVAQSGDDDGAAPTQEAQKARGEDFLANLAENLGISQEDLEAAIRQTALDLVDEKVADGTLTEEEAAKIRERIEEGDGLPFFGGGKHKRPQGGLHGGGEALAEFLGITVEELQEARQDDQSLAQIAEATGVSRDDLIAFLVSQVEEQLAAKVEEGKIDQERADEMLAKFEENVDELVDSTEPVRRRHGPRRGGFEGGSSGFRSSEFSPEFAPESPLF